MSTPPRSGFRSVSETSSQLATWWRATGRRCRWLRPAHPAYVAGVRYKAWKPWSSLHPLDLDTPLRFDLIDRASQLSLGGATYHVVHLVDVRTTPAGERQGGRGTRARRFEAGGHVTGVIDVPALESQLAWRGAAGPTMPSRWICADGSPPLGPLVSQVTGASGGSMTVLGRYLAAVSQPDMFSSASGFDEFAAPDGTVRQGWSTLAEGLDEFAEIDLLAQREVERLLEDDNVTYTPNPCGYLDR